MTHEEFERWLIHHQGAYPGLTAWMKSNPEQLVHWERVVSGISLAEAKGATNRLVAFDEQPRGYTEHPRVIRRLATESRPLEDRQGPRRGPQVRDDRLVAQCPRCMDHGLVSVLSPATIRKLRANDASGGLLTCSLACDCPSGQIYSRRLPRWRSGLTLIRYDDVIDCAAGSHLDMWEAAMEALRYANPGPKDTELTIDALP